MGQTEQTEQTNHLPLLMDLSCNIFFPNLCCSHNVDHAQEELTKF
jgi:hypothetical protein